jgi:hypothetical protein
MSYCSITIEKVFENVGWTAKWEAKGEVRGRAEKAFSIAQNMVNLGLSLDTVVSTLDSLLIGNIQLTRRHKMKHIVSAWRLTLRHLLAALLGASSFFGSCSWITEEAPTYGMPPPERINGKVTYDETPVPGFWVTILRENSSGPYTFTDKDGSFELSFYHYEDYPYTLFFQDVDGPLNGEFNSKTVQWTWGDNPMHIVLQPKE